VTDGLAGPHHPARYLIARPGILGASEGGALVLGALVLSALALGALALGALVLDALALGPLVLGALAQRPAKGSGPRQSIGGSRAKD